MVQCLITWLFPSYKDAAGGWDAGRSNGFVNGYHDGRDNHVNGDNAFGNRGLIRNDRGSRGGSYRTRGGGPYNSVQPGHSSGWFRISVSFDCHIF